MRIFETTDPLVQKRRCNEVTSGADQFKGELPMEGLDKIDLEILRVLQEDASLSAAQIADSVGLSQSPCWRRIQRLKDEGYVSRIVAILDRRKLDLATQLFVQVKVLRNDQASLSQFTDAIRSFQEVLECHVILGVYDFLLRVVVRDMQAYEKFYFGKLSGVPNVREVNSFVAALEVKSTTALPLGCAGARSFVRSVGT